MFRLLTPPNHADTGSGDTTFDWITLLCMLVLAAIVTAIWVALDRDFKKHEAVANWFRLSLRICLAGQMITYGLIKAIPLQMPFPDLNRLLEPYGNLSPMGVLWASIGASPGYEIFAGCAELLGGILLILPRTSMFGALICLADMTQVFALNMTYDVPVKLLSFHLIVFSIVLRAPDFLRLLRFLLPELGHRSSEILELVSDRKSGPHCSCGSGSRGSVAGGGQSVWICDHVAPVRRRQAPKSALYGIWDIEQLTIDGKAREPLITDNERWRRAIFDYPDRMVFQRMDDTRSPYEAAINGKEQTLTLSKSDDPKWKANFTFKRDAEDYMQLEGTMDGHNARMVLHRRDRNKFLLVSRRFHWIQETPFNR